ncbi:MAG: glycosyltransferase family 2 protein [Rhizobiaceae bacterium]|nr:glycosyltransferase family 2 protein [Rhizobiaceae bacterium]
MSSPFQIIRTQIKRQMAMRRFAGQLAVKVNRTKNIKHSDVLLFMCLRNELFRLPFFCDYYRKLGVNHFLIIDNDSTDGVREWARSQPDVSLWHTKASYKESNFGMEWCNYLLRKYGTGHLCVTVDPDEFLVYPCMERRSLRDLGEFMKLEKREVFHTVMLDAYSDRPLHETVYRQGDDPFDVCPYFDRDGYIQLQKTSSPTVTRGGPRMRVHNRLNPERAPALNKVPVVWWQWNFRYVSSMHDLKPTRLMNLYDAQVPDNICGALFHFKFFASLNEKAVEEMKRKQHYQGGTEYERYKEINSANFYEEGLSERYISPEQLISIGLMSRGNWL